MGVQKGTTLASVDDVDEIFGWRGKSFEHKSFGRSQIFWLNKG